MSLDLSVIVPVSIEVKKLKCLISTEISLLLALEKKLAIELVQLDKGERKYLSEDSKLTNGHSFIVSASNYDSEVMLTIIDLPTDDGDLKTHAAISVYASADAPLKLALGFSIAICLAQISRTKIIDENLVWLNNYETSPEEAKSHLALQEVSSDALAAAEKFANKMNMG